MIRWKTSFSNIHSCLHIFRKHCGSDEVTTLRLKRCMMLSNWCSVTQYSCNLGLQHVSAIIHFHWKSNLGTRMRYKCCSMLVVIIREEFWARDETSRKKSTKSYDSKKLKNRKKGKIFYISRMWQKNSVHETRWRPPITRDNTLHFRTHGLEVKVINTVQNLKLNAFRLGLKIFL